MRAQGEDETAIGASIAKRFHGDGGAQGVKTRASERFGQSKPWQATRAALPPQLSREQLLLITLDNIVIELVAGKRRQFGMQSLLLRGEVKIHRRKLSINVALSKLRQPLIVHLVG
jgi:hypothetical protein